MTYRQEPPFCIQIELTEGCPLRCSYCGINGIRDSKRLYKFMTPSLAETIACRIKESGWNSRIEFAMHGEPTMNPKREKIIRIFREALPKQHLMMLSNGIGLCNGDIRSNVYGLLNAGLNCLAIEQYDNCKAWVKIRHRIDEDYIIYPDDPKGNPHKRILKAKRLVFIRNIVESKKGTHAELCNHCGDGGPLDFSKRNEICAKPFREIGICYDGLIPFCCNDFQRRLVFGNVHISSLEEIWQGTGFSIVRKKLFHGQRDFIPCYGCNHRSYRNGLLPDKLGWDWITEATKKDEEELNDYRSKRN